jgi:hypothetical protein
VGNPPFDPSTYVDQMSAVLGLSIDPAHRPGVVASVATLAQVADLVMSFPLPDDIEAGPTFDP